MSKLILSLVLSILGSYLICTHTDIQTFVGVFLFIWANNICFADSVRKVINNEVCKHN